MRWLLKTDKYANSNINKAIETYAPEKDKNNPGSYAQRVKAEMRRQGVIRADLDTVLLKNLTPEELEIMMHAMIKVEGKDEGDVMPL